MNAVVVQRIDYTDRASWVYLHMPTYIMSITYLPTCIYGIYQV